MATAIIFVGMKRSLKSVAIKPLKLNALCIWGTESLMVNPYIVSVDSITFDETERGEDMDVNIVMTTIYGELVL